MKRTKWSTKGHPSGCHATQIPCGKGVKTGEKHPTRWKGWGLGKRKACLRKPRKHNPWTEIRWFKKGISVITQNEYICNHEDLEKIKAMGDKPSSVKVNGQKGEEGQAGTTSVARPLRATMWLRTLGMRKKRWNEPIVLSRFPPKKQKRHQPPLFQGTRTCYWNGATKCFHDLQTSPKSEDPISPRP